MSGYSTRRIVDLEDEVARLKAALAEATASVRDEFACKAMAALIASPYLTSDVPRMVATASYAMADAMLEARGK